MPAGYSSAAVPFLPIREALKPGRVRSRPNPVRLRVVVEPDEVEIEAEIGEQSAIPDLLEPGARVWCRVIPEAARAGTPFSAVLAQARGGALVCLEPSRSVELVARAVQEETIPELASHSLARRSVPYGSSRFDLELEDIIGQSMLVMVETLPAVIDGAALLPAGRSPRSVRQLRALARAVSTGRASATVVLVAPRVDAEAIAVRPDLDPEYADALAEARGAGVRLLAHRCQVTLEEIGLGLALGLRPPAAG